MATSGWASELQRSASFVSALDRAEDDSRDVETETSSVAFNELDTNGDAECAIDKDSIYRTADEKSGSTSTVFYLAYGSNLAAETFLRKRGIKPLSQMNVCVPSLRLTFDLPGIPYIEPCFANTAMRDADKDSTSDLEKATADPSLCRPPYHKDLWHKPLVGVLYGLTPKDFIHVIETEGGGAAYQDIIVHCYPLPAETSTVPLNPSGDFIRAHTLFAPWTPPSKRCHPRPSAGRVTRPDPSYAQPSRRYLKLITDGAAEHNLPAEYREYLAGIRSYKAQERKQRLGKLVFGAIWGPIVMFVFALSRIFAGKNGRIPAWLVNVQRKMFETAWRSYDLVFRRIFGDGERTEDETEAGV